jgi:pilus assembly protein CpaB
MKANAWWAGGVAMTIGLALQWWYVRRLEARVSGGQPVPVLVAARDLDVGTALDEAALAVREIPESYVELRHIGLKDREDIVGEALASKVRAGEALLWSDLRLEVADAELAALVRPGMRAVALQTHLSEGIAPLLRPGDRVDVLATRGVSGVVLAAAGAETLLENILVLSAGRRAPGRSDTALQDTRDGRVTLSVTPGQAQLLAAAQLEGHLTLTLRHPDDTAVETRRATTEATRAVRPLREGALVEASKTHAEIEHVD